MKAQAVVIDGLFLLIICAFASTFLLWAADVYGNQAFRAYLSLYEGEYTTGVINAVSEMKYNVNGVPRHWLDEVAYYFKGEFDDTHDRYFAIMKEWDVVCLQAPVPLQLWVRDALDYNKVLVFNCSLGATDLTTANRLNTSIDVYMTQGCPTTDPCRLPPPYYSSGIEVRLCGDSVCEVEAKIYY